MGKYIDVHAHLESDRFNADLDKVISRAKDKGVLIIQSGTNPETNQRSLEMSNQYGIFCSFGLYPIDAIASEFKGMKDDNTREIKGFDVDSELKWIKEHKNNCVAIGEVGLDFKVIECTEEIKAAQIRNFEKAIDLAIKINKPILIHSRGAEEKSIDILEQKQMKMVVLHCFNGKKSLIRRGIENGWYFSVPPVITRLEHFKTLVDLVPLTQLLTETDAPYLSPIAGERNEPLNVLVTIKEIAKIKNLSEEEVASQIFKNAIKLFKI